MFNKNMGNITLQLFKKKVIFQKELERIVIINAVNTKKVIKSSSKNKNLIKILFFYLKKYYSILKNKFQYKFKYIINLKLSINTVYFLQTDIQKSII